MVPGIELAWKLAFKCTQSSKPFIIQKGFEFYKIFNAKINNGRCISNSFVVFADKSVIIVFINLKNSNLLFIYVIFAYDCILRRNEERKGGGEEKGKFFLQMPTKSCCVFMHACMLSHLFVILLPEKVSITRQDKI